MDIDSVTLENALEVLGQLLTDRDQHYEVVAIGGGSLLLLGQIDRTTKDIDLVALMNSGHLISADPLPSGLLQAVEDVGNTLGLGKEWLNIGPASLFEMGLPSGFQDRMHKRCYHGLTVYLADRFDQICFKLYAAVDQGRYSKHFADLRILQPTREELRAAKGWCITHDVSEPFAIDLEQAVTELEKVHGHT